MSTTPLHPPLPGPAYIKLSEVEHMLAAISITQEIMAKGGSIPFYKDIEDADVTGYTREAIAIDTTDLEEVRSLMTNYKKAQRLREKFIQDNKQLYLDLEILLDDNTKLRSHNASLRSHKNLHCSRHREVESLLEDQIKEIQAACTCGHSGATATPLPRDVCLDSQFFATDFFATDFEGLRHKRESPLALGILRPHLNAGITSVHNNAIVAPFTVAPFLVESLLADIPESESVARYLKFFLTPCD
ncbi:hypothetical protein DFH09DRAFT_1337114 [Mycena vulgaris]|nr:hypothetical protein DFH09DRAFT_1337114 [Mycena vulgaris]